MINSYYSILKYKRINLSKYRFFVRFTILFYSIVICFSCESYVEDFSIKKQPPKTVVNAIVNNSDTLKVYISESMHIDETGITNASLAKTSTLKFFENENELTDIISKENGKYDIIGVSFNPGTKYTIVAQSNKNPEINASIVVPQKPDFEVKDVKLITSASSPGCFECSQEYIQFTLGLNNLPDSAYFAFELKNRSFYTGECRRDTLIWGVNEYHWECLEWDTLEASEYARFHFNNSSLVEFYYDGWDYWTSGELDEIEYERAYFSNLRHSSNRLEMNVRLDRYYANEDSYIKAVLHTYDYSFYEHMRSYTRFRETQYDFLAEKVRVYSNISNGLGLFAVEFTDTITLDISEFAYEYDDEYYY